MGAYDSLDHDPSGWKELAPWIMALMLLFAVPERSSMDASFSRQ
jgi:hypothetical protein